MDKKNKKYFGLIITILIGFISMFLLINKKIIEGGMLYLFIIIINSIISKNPFIFLLIILALYILLISTKNYYVIGIAGLFLIIILLIDFLRIRKILFNKYGSNEEFFYKIREKEIFCVIWRRIRRKGKEKEGKKIG